MGSVKYVVRFLLLNLFFLALPLFIITTISLFNFYEKKIMQGQEELYQIARLRTVTISQWLNPDLPTAKEMIYFWDLGKKELDYAELDKKLEAVAQGNPGYVFSIVGAESGPENTHEILASSDPAFVQKESGRFYVSPQYLETGHGVIMRYYNNISGTKPGYRPLMIGIQGFYNNKNELQGFLTVGVDMTAVLEKILNTSYFLYLSFAILNDQDIVMAASDKTLQGQHFSNISNRWLTYWRFNKDLGEIEISNETLKRTAVTKTGFFQFKWHNQEQIACVVPIPGMQLSILVFTPKEPFFTRAFNQYVAIYVVYLTILIIGLIAMIWVGIWIARPLRQLSGLMHKVSEGNLNVRFHPLAFGYEINRLGGIFNSTLTAIQNHMEQAENERVKKEIYQRELELGREVQKNLFPRRFPEIPGIDIAGCYIPSNNVSGDFYLIEKHQAGLLIAIFDVDGKGIHSSLYGLSVRSLLRTYAVLIEDVGELMTKVNAAFSQESELQASAFVALLDPKSLILSYVSCGHPPSIVKRRSGDAIELEGYGTKLAESADTSFTAHTLQMQKEDILFVYVDGLCDATSSLGNPIGIPAVKETIQRGEFATAEEGVEALNKLWEEHTGEKTPTDEILILTCRILS